MKVAVFGSCMSNLTAVWLKLDYQFEQTHSVHHNRSDSFLRYFVDESAEMIPRAFFDDLLVYRPGNEAEARQFLLNQYRDGVGYHDLRDRQTSPAVNFFDEMKTQPVDIVLMDNFMDVAAKLMTCRSVPEYSDRPIFLNPGFYENEAEVSAAFAFSGDFLTPAQSAENFVRIYRWLRAMQPRAKFFFLPYHSCTSRSTPDRFERARDFYPALLAAAAGEDLHILPPLELPDEHTKGEADWAHFQMPIYRGLAGYVYLATVSGLAPPTAAWHAAEAA